MMKKLLVLMMVLGMASLANAALVLSVNGQEAPDEITLAPSDWIELDVHLSEGHTLTAFELLIVLNSDQGTLDSSPIEFPETWTFAPYIKTSSPALVEVTGGDSFPKNGPLVVLQGVMFHADGPDSLLISLITTGDTIVDGETIQAGVVQDVIIAHIPEPMTMVLLGLGAVMLRRKHS